MVNHIVADIEGCEAYVDDLIVYSQTWEQHIWQLRRLFEKLSQAKLTVNLVKSEFCQANVVNTAKKVSSPSNGNYNFQIICRIINSIMLLCGEFNNVQ